MCFEVEKNSRAKIAKLDIECWKYLYAEWYGKRMVSICNIYEYKKGKKNPIKKLIKEPDRDSVTGIGINIGYHSFKNKKAAETSDLYTHDGLFKFIIPAGTRYYENINEYVSETIMLVE